MVKRRLIFCTNLNIFSNYFSCQIKKLARNEITEKNGRPYSEWKNTNEMLWTIVKTKSFLSFSQNDLESLGRNIKSTRGPLKPIKITTQRHCYLLRAWHCYFGISLDALTIRKSFNDILFCFDLIFKPISPLKVRTIANLKLLS